MKKEWQFTEDDLKLLDSYLHNRPLDDELLDAVPQSCLAEFTR